MDKAIITILLVVAGVVCVAVMFNGIYPAINRGSDAVVSMASQVDDRIKSQVSIIHVASEYNTSTDNWDDDNSNGDFDLFAWVKNVGTSRIMAIDRSDLFFGEEGDFQRIAHTLNTSGTPSWNHSFEDSASQWIKAKTMKITIAWDDFASSGLAEDTTYFMKLIIPNGVSDETYFSL